jgi:hypothetical protein
MPAPATVAPALGLLLLLLLLPDACMLILAVADVAAMEAAAVLVVLRAPGWLTPDSASTNSFSRSNASFGCTSTAGPDKPTTAFTAAQ